MDLGLARHGDELAAELRVKPFGIVAHHLEPAAALRALGAEGGDQDVAARLERAPAVST